MQDDWYKWSEFASFLFKTPHLSAEWDSRNEGCNEYFPYSDEVKLIYYNVKDISFLFNVWGDDRCLWLVSDLTHLD